MENKNIFKNEVDLTIIINLVLYAIILIMPYVIVIIENKPYVSGKVYFMYIVFSLGLIAFIKLGNFNINRYEVVAVVFLLSMFIATIFSPYKEIAFWGSIERFDGFITITVYICLFIFSSKYIKVNKKTINIMFVIASIMSIYGILQFYGVDPIQKLFFGEILISDSVGTIGNRNFFSTYICIFLFSSMSLYILKGGKNYLVYSTILFSGLLCSLTRGGWLAFIIYSITGLFMIIGQKQCLKRAMVVLTIFISLLAIINSTSCGKIISRADVNLIVSENEGKVEFTGSSDARIEIMKISWRAFISRPLLGTGPDTLQLRLYEDFPNEFIEYSLRHNSIIDKSHNEYLQYAVDGGITTILSYITLIGLIVKELLSNYKDDKFKILLLTLIGYLIQAFLNISVVMVAPIYWIFLGYCVQCILTLNKEC